MASAGSTIQACSILAWNPTPTQNPDHSSERRRASITARW